MKVQEVTEQEMAEGVQETKRVLLELLPERMRGTTPVRGSENAITFEDNARARIEDLEYDHDEDGAEALKGALEDFQAAVNAYWTWTIRHGLPTALAAEWRKKHRKHAQHLAKDDIEAEVIFILRHFIIRFTPTGEERLFSYAYRGVLQHLTEWSAQQGPVELPQKAARGVLLSEMRQPLDGDERAYSPHEVIDRYLDGEITEGDL